MIRLVTIILAVLLVLIQYPLWLGKSGFFRVRDLGFQLEATREKNEEIRQRNERLASEVRDLEAGTEAVEERARYELGLIKKDEVFIQIIDATNIPKKNQPIEERITLPEKVRDTSSADDSARP